MRYQVRAADAVLCEAEAALVFVGDANGYHRGGNHIRAADGTPMANAMLTALNWLGHEMESFGDSNGELTI